MIPPFSVLDTRTNEWKKRKEYWISTYGIQSELGREQTDSKSVFWDSPSTNVSIFDPTLCELMYKWFSPKGGNILDPFAGGSVRGIVAEEMGRNYTGIDLSQTQIEANRKQSSKPNWIIGDSKTKLFDLDGKYDFIFTCPPYYDLEIYTDNKYDLSNMDIDVFDNTLESILYQSSLKLKNNRFFGIVVSEVRNQSKTGNYSIGNYKGLVHKTIQMCEKHGLSFYNDMILFNSQHQASKVAKTYFDRNRKIPSVHQNILIFVKGNPDIATEEIKGGEPVCMINQKEYLSFRHAAIDIEPNKLVASEVERRCRSTKSSYQNWQITGKETKPIIKYEVDGVPFESPTQIAEKTEMNTQECRNLIESNNPVYRHWKRVDSNTWDISYKELEEFWNTEIDLMKPSISCNGQSFYSLKEAGDVFGISSERVRQKIKDDKFQDWNYLYS